MREAIPIWITWEHQRRSVVLSKEFGTEYQVLVSSKRRLARYVILSLKTARLLIRQRPSLLFVQNPSMLLAFVACLYRMCSSRTFLIVDRHSNFYPISRSNIVNMAHNALSNFTLERADLTIVTNERLNHLVESLGGKAVVLEDKIPELRKTNDLRLKGKRNILYICSFDADEPFREVFKAVELLSPDIYVYVSGNYDKIKNKVSLKRIPQNLVLLGFVSDADYVDYLYAVDAVMVLTEWDHTLLCGAYEAICAEKPMILSNKKDLIEYFSKGVVKTENDSRSIAYAIEAAITDKHGLTQEIQTFKAAINVKWQMKFNKINQIIKSMQTTRAKG